MEKRTKIINDPAEFVSLLRIFCSKKHKEIFDILSLGWQTEKEMEEISGYEIGETFKILADSGLLASRWRMPKPGENPDEEYHSSYSDIVANFQCSFEDFADMVKIAFIDDEELEEITNAIIDKVTNGMESVGNLCRTLNLKPAFLRCVAHRSHIFAVVGQRIKLLKED
jgi:predicted DNA-binding ArsR family transcriptional regulator